jgi:cytochrome c1
VSAGACSGGHAREASRSGWPLPRTRGLLFSSLSPGERRTRSASEGKELLASEFAAGIGPRDAKLAAATTILAHCNRCGAQIISVVIVLFIVSCANFAPPPEVSPALISNARSDHVDAGQLQNGRRLFVSRCLECHTLPPVTRYTREQWPHLVSRMSGRANLSAGEQAAIVAYLRAASLTPH